MSVRQVKIAVNKFVLTLLNLTPALVMMDIFFIVTIRDALVR